MANIFEKLKDHVVNKMGYTTSYLKSAALASCQSESCKHYKRKKQASDDDFVKWYIGECYSSKQMATYLESIGVSQKEMEDACWLGVAEAIEQIKERDDLIEKLPRIGRNESCPCGSGRKYKKCCGR